MGLRISEDEKIYCKDVEISYTAIAKATDVDRRTVKATVKELLNDKELSKIFRNIIPAGFLLKNLVKDLNLGLIEIEANADNPGILAEAAKILASENISIRQAYAEDPKIEGNPKLTIITEIPIPGKLFRKFLDINGVKRVTIC